MDKEKNQSKCRPNLLHNSKIDVKVQENPVKVTSGLRLKPLNAKYGLDSSGTSANVGRCSVWPPIGL